MADHLNKRVTHLEKRIHDPELELRGSREQHEEANEGQNNSNQQSQSTPQLVLPDPAPRNRGESEQSGNAANPWWKRGIGSLKKLRARRVLETIGVIAGIGYAVVTYLQWRNLTHNFEVDQRAWIGVAKFQGADFTESVGHARSRAVYVKEGEDIRIGAEMSNPGKSIAKYVTGCVRWDTAPSKDKFVPKCDPTEQSSAIVQPGVGVTFWSQGKSGFRATPDLIQALRNGDVRLYVHGSLTYQDIFDHLHFTKFCMSVSRDLSVFGAYGGREYNDAN